MENKKIKEFPDVENKLQGMTKRSLFEKQKAEQESKRAREAAETAAVLEDFVKSFDEDEDVPGSDGFKSERGSGFGGFGGFNGPPRRHFGSAPTGPSAGRGGFGGRTSGPGTLGPPPASFNRKRTYEGFQPQSRRDNNDRGLLAFEDYDNSHTPPHKAFNTSDDEDDKRHEGKAAEQAISKPTIRLANLPPGTSPAVIKALLPSNLTADAVRILPHTGPGASTERKSMTAIVTLSKETAGNDIDTAVNSLQNRYLGYGFYLSLHRHLSSAALSSVSVASGTVSNSASQPFGAKAVNLDIGSSQGPGPAGFGRGFAPPTSYAPTGPGQLGRSGPIMHVPVQAPKDVKELKLIHKTIENLLTHGPKFEALLMSRPEVQKEEKWAWLWDPRSTGGVWYRWRLWEILTGAQGRRKKEKYLPLFEDSSAWKAPDRGLTFEYTTRLEEFVSDSDYDSSDEDDSGDEGRGRRHHGGAPDVANPNTDDGMSYLNPLKKAKLTHLLARLPTSTGKLRKGDVARVTAFAISHAGQGADEVVAAVISNIEKPFAFTNANPERRREKEANDDDGAATAGNEDEEKSDTSSASLIGLYLISDILSSSSTSGVRHAWRYRQLFEAALKQQHVFEKLGRFEKKMNWGRLRAEKWKRSVGNVLSLWEGWCVFPQESQDHFVSVFNDPPLTKEEEKDKKEREMEGKSKSKWKAVEKSAETANDGFGGAASKPLQPAQDVADGEPMEEDVDGEPMEEEDVDGEPMDPDDDFDGEPMEEDNDVNGAPMDNDEEDAYEPPPPELAPKEEAQPSLATDASMAEQGTGSSSIRPPRRRPKAEDMFADSGSEGE